MQDNRNRDNQHSNKNIQLLFTVTRRSDAARYTDFYRSHAVPLVYNFPARGTATASTLDLFGLEATEKAVLCTIVSGGQVRSLCAALTTEMMIDLPDQGIAVALPLSSMGGQAALDHFFAGGMPADIAPEKEKEDAFMEQREAPSFELIVAIAEKGQTDLVMDAARAGGARGGTVVHAKGTAGAGTQTFFGVSLAEEKEMLFIVADTESKREIMRSIMQNAGASTDARAVVFSLPVTEACGFRYGNG